jgi:D-alanyl-D-alanine carboxypeptidase (penicillin-binding protein 5/6)
MHSYQRKLILSLIFSFLISIFSLSISFADEIRSRAGIVIDASTGNVLYAKKPCLRQPPASTAKLMTAIVVLEMTNLSDVVKISRNAAHISPLKAGFREGERATVETLLYAMLMRSANDAALALAEAIAGSEERFVSLMNRKAADIGAMDTKFINSNGLPGPGQYTTVLDLSKIMKYTLRYPKLREIIGTRVAEVSTEEGSVFFLKNINKLMWRDEDLIGGKTGYTLRAKHCFVGAAEHDNKTLIVALLGSPSREKLWKETEVLINKGLLAIANKEDPFIYISKTDYDFPYLSKATFAISHFLSFKDSKLLQFGLTNP